MKQNRYDDRDFFEKYSQMERSKKGLAGAGEWYELKKMLPDFRGKRVLDLGCGFGWHCIYAAEHGAASVVGVDISRRMLERAARMAKAPQIEYICMPLEDYQPEKETFDTVLSSLVFHYVESFADVCRMIFTALKPGGDFVFSVEHPVFTAEGRQDWCYDENGTALHWPVDRYYMEGAREAVFLGEKMVKYHRTLDTYLGTLFRQGFAITGVVEPRPDPSMMELPGMKEELRRPMMLLVSAKKQG